jgi:hypothetical protein
MKALWVGVLGLSLLGWLVSALPSPASERPLSSDEMRRILQNLMKDRIISERPIKLTGRQDMDRYSLAVTLSEALKELTGRKEPLKEESLSRLQMLTGELEAELRGLGVEPTLPAADKTVSAAP